MVVLIGCCRRGGKRMSFRWRGIILLGRVKDELVASWLGVAESMVERECRERLAAEKTGEEAGFFWFLDPILSSLGPSNPPIFIGGGRGQYFLQYRKISALDSDGKDPNRWLKVGMVHCQIVKSTAAGCLSWPLWGGAMSVYFPVSRWRPYPDVERCLMISFVQVLTTLVDVRCIKCTCKGGDWTSFSGKKEKDNE